MIQNIHKRILFIDDEEPIRDAFSLLLRGLHDIYDFIIDVASSGYEGLSLFDNQVNSGSPYDIVITDLFMPDITGFDVCNTILARFPDLPIIMITGHATAETAVHAMKLGVYDYFSKPINFEEVRNSIKEALKKDNSHIRGKSNEDNSLEITIRRLLREKTDLERQLEIIKKELQFANLSACKIEGKPSKEDIFLDEVGELIRPVIHDIKAPISVLSSYLYMLSMSSSSDKLSLSALANNRKIINKCNEQIEQLKIFLDELRFLGGHSSSNFVKIDINNYIKQNSAQIRKRYKAISLKLRLTKKNPLIEADETSLAQLIKNIITNAFEACDGVSGQVTITTRVLAQPSFIEIIIEDNGHGIAPSIKDKIYNLHFSTKKTGFGIGLYLAKKAVELHNGIILCESNPGESTSFTISLPVSREEG